LTLIPRADWSDRSEW